MGLEKKRDTDSPPEDDGKDLMQSTLIALGWEESKDGEGMHKSPSKDDVIKQLKQENQALAKQLEEKIATITASEARISTMAGEIDRLKANIDQLEKASIAIAPVAVAATSPGGDVADLAEKLAIQKEVNAGLEAKLKALAASREGGPDTRGKIEVELASKQAEIDSLYDKLREATTKIDEQAGILSAKDATISDQGQKINELDECVKDLKQQVIDIIGENTGLGSEVQTKLEQLSQRENKISQLESRLRDQEAEIEKSKVSIGTLKSENEELRYRIKEYETVIEKHKNDLLQTESDTSEGMGRLQQIIDDLKEEIATLKKDKQAAIARSESLARQVDDGEKKRIGVEAVLDKTSKDLAFYQEKYFDLKARLKAVDVQIDELQRSNEQKSAFIKDLELARATFDAAKKTMDAEHAKLAAELESQKAMMAEKLKVMEEGGVFKVKLEQAEARIGQLEAMLAGAQKAAQSAEKDAKDTKARLDSLQNDLKKVTDEKARMDEQLKVSKSKIDQLEKELENASGNDDLIDKVFMAETENSKLKEDLALKEKEVEKYKRRINELQDAAKGKDAIDEEIKNLKISNKELRRRLEKYEKP